MDREEVIRLLKGGIEGIREFNRRRESGEELPSLEKADLNGVQLWFNDPEIVAVNLSGADLDEANLSQALLGDADLSRASLFRANLSESALLTANLSGANLRLANLSSTSFHYTNLSGTKLSDTDLRKTNFSSVNLSGADLSSADLSGVKLHSSDMSGARLSNANLRQAVLQGAELGRANLRDANLNGAILRYANLSEAMLGGANLSQANLQYADVSDADVRRAKGMLLDNTFIRHARFDARAKDPWSVLRNSYTGPALLFNLIFLCTFLGVYAAKAAFWIGVNRSQQSALVLADKLAATHPQLAEGLGSLEPTFTEHSQKMAVWQVLLAMDRGPWLMILAVVLIVYNVVRWLLTRQVAAMRDAEERSGYSPEWVAELFHPAYEPPRFRVGFDEYFLFAWLEFLGPQYHGYRWCWLLHAWIARPLFWIAVVSFLWHAWYWLNETVYLPK